MLHECMVQLQQPYHDERESGLSGTFRLKTEKSADRYFGIIYIQTQKGIGNLN